MQNNKYFIAIYTNQVKDYCDEEFFNQVNKFKLSNPVHIVDNTVGSDYFKRLKRIAKGKDNNLYKIGVPEHPKRTQFLRNVAESVEYLREIFLQSDCQHFIIIESDVIPPDDLIEKFNHSIFQIELEERARLGGYGKVSGQTVPETCYWGAIGAHYYNGFHDMEKKDLYKTHHTLSGCTVYSRWLLEDYHFRWSEENLGSFPDAWMCYDAGKEYEFYNDGRIVCEHLAAENGTRQSKQL